MSRRKENTPAQDTNQVGYGKPPVRSRFRKGQSGNPSGKRRRQSLVDQVNTLLRQEAYRLLTVREGDKVTRMPALQAVLRSQIASAAKGNVPAQRAVVKAVQDLEAEGEARRAGGSINKKIRNDLNELTDEELMAIVRAERNDEI